MKSERLRRKAVAARSIRAFWLRVTRRLMFWLRVLSGLAPMAGIQASLYVQSVYSIVSTLNIQSVGGIREGWTRRAGAKPTGLVALGGVVCRAGQMQRSFVGSRPLWRATPLRQDDKSVEPLT